MMGFDQDFSFQQRFAAHMIEIAQRAVRVEFASWEDDTKHATDLMIMANGARIGCRVRRHAAACYSDEFTIRLSRPSGVETEMAKMCAGWGDFGIYGFESEPGSDRLSPWVLYNIHLLREYIADGGGYKEIPNHDGTWFAAFNIDQVLSAKPGFVLASGGLSSPEPARLF